MTKQLIHIGYPKAGSSYLQAWFEQHPAFHFKPGGVSGFYDVWGVIRCAVRQPELAEKWLVTSTELLSVPSPTAGTRPRNVHPEQYGTIQEQQTQVCELLHALFPAAKILIVVRGWRGILTSGYSQYVRTGGTRPMDAVYWDNPTQISDVYDYDYLIGRYEQQFGAENVLVLPFELLRESESNFQAAICDQLDVTHQPARVGIVNKTLSSAELRWYPAISRRFDWLPGRLARLYMGLTFYGRLKPVAQLLAKVTGEGEIRPIEDDLIKRVTKTPHTLRHRPLFQPYLDRYFID